MKVTHHLLRVLNNQHIIFKNGEGNGFNIYCIFPTSDSEVSFLTDVFLSRTREEIKEYCHFKIHNSSSKSKQ